MATPIPPRALRQIARPTLGALEAELRDLNLEGFADDQRLSPAQQRAVARLNGNANGVLFDEGSGRTPAWKRNVVAKYGQASAAVGLSRRDEERFFTDVLGALEVRWGAPVTQLLLDAIPRRGVELAIRKASQLERMGLPPARVQDFVVRAEGRVDGVPTKARRLFGQHFAAADAVATGKVVVLSPGFQETGRSFERQIQEMLSRGYDVVTMDHQWAGHSDGPEGSFDSAAGLARDVAAVCAHAQQLVQTRHADRPGAEVVLFGNSMGGMAALYAKAMTDAGRVDLAKVSVTTDAGGAETLDARMPQGMKLMLQAPFLGLSDGLLNRTLAFAGRVPVMNKIALPSNGIAPKISSDREVGLHNAQETLLEHLSAKPEAMRKGLEGAERVLEFTAARPLAGAIGVYHQIGDTLADHGASRGFVDRLVAQRGPAGVHMVSAEGVDHVVEHDPDVFKDPIDVLDRVAKGG